MTRRCRMWSVCISLVLCVFFGHVREVRANAAYLRAKRHYNAFQFQRAIAWLRRASRARMTPMLRVRAAVLQALCHYNLGQFGSSKRAYHTALSLDRVAALPPGQSPAIIAHFRKLKARWLVNHPPKRLAPIRVRRPQRRIRRRIVRRRLVQPKPKPGFAARHKGSLVLLGVTIAVLGGGIAASVVYQGQNEALQQLRGPTIPGQQLQMAYDKAFVPGLAATILYATSGALAAVTIGVFIAER